MYKKWLSCALSVLCSFCLFWGLYSNTLEVNAASSGSLTPTSSGSVTLTFDNVGTTVSGSGYISNGSGTISVSSGASGYGSVDCDVLIPLMFRADASSIDTSNYYSLEFNPRWSTLSWSYSKSGMSSESYTVSNVSFLDSNKRLLASKDSSSSSSSPLGIYSASDVINYSNGVKYFTFYGYLSFHLSVNGYYSFVNNDPRFTLTGSLNPSFWISVRSDSAGAIQVNDSAVQTQVTNINTSTQNIEQYNQEIAESVTSDTGGGLLATIKNFFGGFFSNIFNTILSLFVPDSTYFSTWFDNLNTLLSAKLGMLYAPFDLLISTLNAVYSADTTEPGITFPGITWDGETVIEPYTFYFSSLGEDFQNLRDAVYFATDVVFLFAFLHLLQKKIALVITGSEVNG